MVWCKHCAKNVPGIRTFDGALCCELCGRILENFYFSTLIKNAAGQIHVRDFLNDDVLEELFDISPAEKSPKRSETEADMEKSTTKKEEKEELKSNEHENGENEDEAERMVLKKAI